MRPPTTDNDRSSGLVEDGTAAQWLLFARRSRPGRLPRRLTLECPGLGQTDETLDVLVATPFPLFLGR